GIFFDWKNQADSIINGVRLSDEERARSRVMLVDASHKVIASSDAQSHLGQNVDLKLKAGQASGYSAQ
ncbi:chemotaxis protein, partial [Pseudomonas quasicaspiana]|nr:chemotaxis protein [Pseudomonas quasicaspiana]